MSLLLLFNGSQPASIVVGVTPSTSIAGGQRTSGHCCDHHARQRGDRRQRINASIDAVDGCGCCPRVASAHRPRLRRRTPTASVSGGQRYNVTITGTTTPTSSATGRQQRDTPTISPRRIRVHPVLLSPSGTSARIETPETVARDDTMRRVRA